MRLCARSMSARSQAMCTLIAAHAAPPVMTPPMVACRMSRKMPSNYRPLPFSSVYNPGPAASSAMSSMGTGCPIRQA